MRSMYDYAVDARTAAVKRQQVLVDLCIRCRRPLEANLTKDEAILLLTALARGEFDNIVARNVEQHAMLSATARAK